MKYDERKELAFHLESARTEIDGRVRVDNPAWGALDQLCCALELIAKELEQQNNERHHTTTAAKRGEATSLFMTRSQVDEAIREIQCSSYCAGVLSSKGSTQGSLRHLLIGEDLRKKLIKKIYSIGEKLENKTF